MHRLLAIDLVLCYWEGALWNYPLPVVADFIGLMFVVFCCAIVSPAYGVQRCVSGGILTAVFNLMVYWEA